LSKPLEGKVVEILSDYLVAISLGEKQGVKKSDDFHILAKPVIIKDGETELGALDYIKATVSIKQIYENFSVVENVESATSSVYRMATMLDYSPKPLPVKAVETRIDTEIRIGDRVLQIIKPKKGKKDT